MSPQPLIVLDTSHISPPQGSAPSATLPLTFFDAPWLTLPLAHSVFFYSYDDSTAHFLSNTLPHLKHSLSLTLQHFYPYAGNLICPPRPDPPYLRYNNDGQNSLVFTVVESTEHDFNHLKADYPRDISALHDLVPKLPPAHVLPEGTQTRPVMAIQVTVFPGSGICIGNTATHVAADGVSFMHFIKYWMSMCKCEMLDGDSPRVFSLPPLPVHACREVIKDPGEVISGHLERFWSLKPQDGVKHDVNVPPANLVRATFSMSRAQIENLKSWVKEQSANQSPVSTFVVTMAFTWACLIKSLVDKDETENNHEDEIFRLLLNVDCRNRLKYEETIPSTFFGNCMAPGVASVKKKELVGQNGVLVASNAIASRIKEMLSSDILRTAPKWSGEVRKWVMSRFAISIAGAPKLGMYDTDFGLGKPCKVEIVHVESGGSIAILDSRDGQDGIELGLALREDKMDLFASNFEEGLKNVAD